MSNVGDRKGNLVFVKNPFGDGHVWLDIESGQVAEKKCCGSCRDSKGYVRQKQDVVKLFRYVRPGAPYPYGGIDNLRGLTFYIELDYKNRDIRFSFSRCEGDNFDKKLGKQIAFDNFENGIYWVLKMDPSGVAECGVLGEIFECFKTSWNDLKEQKPVLRQGETGSAGRSLQPVRA